MNSNLCWYMATLARIEAQQREERQMAIDYSQVGWRKSSACNGSAACVEVAHIDGAVVVRDSKEQAGPVLVFGEGEWARFLEGVKRGEFDVETLARAAVGSDGSARARVSEPPYAELEPSQVSQ